MDSSNPNLPADTISNILSRLPTKSVGRFRCVSKPWQAMLSRPKFIQAHLDQIKNLREESFIFIYGFEHFLFTASLSNADHPFDEITISVKKIKFPGECKYWNSVYVSCDGLLLTRDAEDQEFVLNPITKEIREVPRSPFALDPHESCIMYGLGYDLVDDDYKIVTLSYYDSDNEHNPDDTEMYVNVYSLNGGSWKRAESSPYDHSVGDPNSGVSVNGCIHWLACRTSDYKSVIVAFDLAEEKFHEVPPPSRADNDKFVFNHLALLGGCLCMLDNGETDAWIMKEYGVEESWTKFKIYNPESYELRLLCVLGQEETIIFKDDDHKLVMYNLREGTLKDIVVNAIEDDGIHINEIEHDLHPEAIFVESLVSPHGAN